VKLIILKQSEYNIIWGSKRKELALIKRAKLTQEFEETREVTYYLNGALTPYLTVRVEKIKITSRPANTLIGPGENSRSHNDYGHDKIRAKVNEIETFFTSTNMH